MGPAVICCTRNYGGHVYVIPQGGVVATRSDEGVDAPIRLGNSGGLLAGRDVRAVPVHDERPNFPVLRYQMGAPFARRSWVCDGRNLLPVPAGGNASASVGAGLGRLRDWQTSGFEYPTRTTGLHPRLSRLIHRARERQVNDYELDRLNRLMLMAMRLGFMDDVRQFKAERDELLRTRREEARS